MTRTRPDLAVPPRCRALPWPALLLLCAAACNRAASHDVEVRVRQVALDPATRSPVVLLEDPVRDVALPIWIGPAEAQSIATELEGDPPPRPLTHDLMKTVLDQVGVALQRVVIRELRGDTYLADLILEYDGEELAIDSRPSDAIALAVRFDRPIFVRRALFAREAVVDLRGRGEAAAVTVGGVTVQELSADLARHFELPEDAGGVLVAEAETGAPLQRGDVVLEIDGEPVRDPADFRARLRATGRVSLRVQRDGERLQVTLHAAGVPD